jgi:crotonobetainyl-CoA:carnitine CoA-transferase CaiB-like acyl-CoA transferase
MSDIMDNKKSSKSRVGNRHPTVLPWNVFKSADDMVLICAGTQPQWQRLCKVIGRPDLDDASTSTQEGRGTRIEEIEVAIEHWTSQLSTRECVRILSDAGIPGGSLVRIDGHPDEANLEYRKMVQRLFDPVTGRDIFVPGSALRMSVTPGIQPERLPVPDADRDEVKRMATRQKRSAGPSTANRPARPLEGVRVVEIGQYTTAPLAARQLAALGADVIKVEPPGGADGRTWLPVVKGQSVGFRAHNADKQSIVIDLKSEDGKDVLRRLIETADVLVENQKPGTLAKLGFSAQQIAQINPRIVYCAISGFGADSLYASRPAFDMIIQAMSGFMDAVASGTTLKSGISTSDLMGAEMAIVGILAALEYRARSGRGQYLDLSMQDITAWVAQPAWNRDPNGSDAAPLVVACADGYITTEAPRDEIGKALQAANSSLDKFSELDREAAASLLSAVGIAAAPVQTVREGVAHPQTSERRLWFTVNEGGEVWPLFASPLRLLRTPPAVLRPCSNTNEDGPAILEKFGLSQAKARQAVAE